MSGSNVLTQNVPIHYDFYVINDQGINLTSVWDIMELKRRDMSFVICLYWYSSVWTRRRAGDRSIIATAWKGQRRISLTHSPQYRRSLVTRQRTYSSGSLKLSHPTVSTSSSFLPFTSSRTSTPEPKTRFTNLSEAIFMGWCDYLNMPNFQSYFKIISLNSTKLKNFSTNCKIWMKMSYY